MGFHAKQLVFNKTQINEYLINILSCLIISDANMLVLCHFRTINSVFILSIWADCLLNSVDPAISLGSQKTDCCH